MAKKVKKLSFPKFENLIKECIESLKVDWPKIIGQGINLVFNKFECDPFYKFMSRTNSLTTLLEYEISGEFPSKFFIMLSHRDIVIISGSILMENTEDIEENIIATRITADYQDAFDEFANQTSSSFENIFRAKFPDDDTRIRLVQSYLPPIEPEKVKEILPVDDDDEIVIINNQYSVWTFDKGDINLLFPKDVAERFFDETVNLSDEKLIAEILVISDSKSDISFIKKYLRNTGYYTHVREDGNSTISKLQRDRDNISLVLLDAEFGDQTDNGFLLCQRIKRNILLDSIPVIMCSSKPTKSLITESLKLGVSDFLVMPFDKDKLLSKLKKYIKIREKGFFDREIKL